MQIKGNRTYATAVVMLLVALASYFDVVDLNSQQFLEVQTGLGAVLGFFLRAGVDKK